MTMTPPPAGVNLSMVVVSSDVASEVKLGKLLLPVKRDHLLNPFFRNEWLVQFLDKLEVPRNFFNGCDCDMITNLSRMVCDSMVQVPGAEEDHIGVVVMVFKNYCAYNVIKTPIHADDHGPSREEMVKVACGEGSDVSVPAGASTIEGFQVEVESQDEYDNCVICLKDFKIGENAAKLMPCSHVYHYSCILEWFVRKRTCPVCRCICSHAIF